MGKELATKDAKFTDSTAWLALQPDSEIREVMEANLGEGETLTEQDLVRIPTPAGGGTTWTWEGIEGEETAKTIDGIMVGLLRRGVLWPYDEPNESPPLLITHDFKRAHMIGDDPGDIDLKELEKYRNEDGKTFDWPNLPWVAWDSGKDGGKRAKEQRVLFILRKEDTWPVIVTAQPGSLKTIIPFIRRLPVQHWRAVVSLGLQKVKSRGGKDYAQIVPKLIGTLDREAGAAVWKMYTEPIQQIASQRAFSTESSSG